MIHYRGTIIGGLDGGRGACKECRRVVRGCGRNERDAGVSWGIRRTMVGVMIQLKSTKLISKIEIIIQLRAHESQCLPSGT